MAAGPSHLPPLKSYLRHAKAQFFNNVMEDDLTALSSNLWRHNKWQKYNTYLKHKDRVGNGTYGTVLSFKPVNEHNDDWVNKVVFKQITIDPMRKDSQGFPPELPEAVLTKYFGDLSIGTPCDASHTFPGHDDAKPNMNLFVASNQSKTKMFIVMNKMHMDMQDFFEARAGSSDIARLLNEAETQLRERFTRMLENGFLCWDMKLPNVLVDATPGREQFFLSDFDPTYCCSFDLDVQETGVLKSTGSKQQPCRREDVEKYRIVIEGMIAMSLIGATDLLIFPNSLNRLVASYLYDFLKGTLYRIEAHEQLLGAHTLPEQVRVAKKQALDHLKALEEEGNGALMSVNEFGYDSRAITGGPMSRLYDGYGIYYGNEIMTNVRLQQTPALMRQRSVMERAQEVLLQSLTDTGNSTIKTGYHELGWNNSAMILEEAFKRKYTSATSAKAKRKRRASPPSSSL